MENPTSSDYGMSLALIPPLTSGFHRRSPSRCEPSDVTCPRPQAARRGEPEDEVRRSFYYRRRLPVPTVSLHFAEVDLKLLARALHEFADHVSAENLVGFSTCHFSEVPRVAGLVIDLQGSPSAREVGAGIAAGESEFLGHSREKRRLSLSC